MKEQRGLTHFGYTGRLVSNIERLAAGAGILTLAIAQCSAIEAQAQTLVRSQGDAKTMPATASQSPIRKLLSNTSML